MLISRPAYMDCCMDIYIYIYIYIYQIELVRKRICICYLEFLFHKFFSTSVYYSQFVFYTPISPVFEKKIDESKFHYWLYYSNTFSLRLSPIWVSKRRNNKESMSCLTSKPSQKISEIIGISLWPPSTPDLNPLDYAICGDLENKMRGVLVA